MRVDGDAAAVVGDRHEAVGLHRHVDAARVARHGLVHGIVDHLGEEVVQAGVVRAADIHAGPAPHRLQPFQHLDGGRGVAGLVRRPVAERQGATFLRGLGRHVVVHGEEVLGQGCGGF